MEQQTLAARVVAYLEARRGQPIRLYELKKVFNTTGGQVSRATKNSPEAAAAGIVHRRLGWRTAIAFIGPEPTQAMIEAVRGEPPHKPPTKRVKRPATHKVAMPVKAAGEKGTLPGIISGMLSRAGDKGMTMEDIALKIKKYLPQYSPNSGSPAVTHLIRLGCAREARNFGVRHIYHVRDFNYEKDAPKLAALNKRANGAVHSKVVAAGEGSAQILIAVGSSKTETMTIEEARRLYGQLDQLFGK